MPIYGGNGNNIYRVAVHAAPAFTVLYDVDGYYADTASSDAPSHAPFVIAVVQSGVSAGGVVTLARQGVFIDSSLTIPIGRLFLGIGGVITNIPPTSGMLVQVGFAASHGTAIIDVQTARLIL
jgi:hypothetical protein